MMNKMNPAEIAKLLEAEVKGPAVTIYLPTHKASSPPNMTEDQIRFKNLANKALDIMDNRDKHDNFNKEFKNACQDLLDDQDFWAHMSESMLICARPGLFEYFHLPIDSDEYVAVADHFHLTPVLGLLYDFQEYYVLTISQHKPLLLKGDAYGLASTGTELPESIEAALNIDEMHQRSVQFYSIQSSKGAEFHGHGGAKDTGDAERLRYFRIIDGIVNTHTDKKLPLVLAGIDSEIAEYRSISHYPKIVSSHIHGHFRERDIHKLHEKAAEIIENEIISSQHKEAIERYERLHGRTPERASESIADLKDAAEKGRIGTLLVGMSRKTRDTVRDNMKDVRKLVFPRDEESGAIDYIAWQVFNQSGEIFNMAQEEMPSNKLILSINRY